MMDKILALFSLCLLIAFLAIVVVFVNEPNLWGVVLLVLGFAGYDFWTTVRGDNGNDGAA